MWTIIFTTMLVSENGGKPAVHVEQIGNYKSLSVCQQIANQLIGSTRKSLAVFPSKSENSPNYTHLLTTTARCVQVKDPK